MITIDNKEVEVHSVFREISFSLRLKIDSKDDVFQQMSEAYLNGKPVRITHNGEKQFDCYVREVAYSMRDPEHITMDLRGDEVTE